MQDADPTYHEPPVRNFRSGRNRLLTELTGRDRVAGPTIQALEVPATWAGLHGLTGEAHPQMVLRVGRAAVPPPTPRRPSRTALLNGTRSAEPRRPRGLPVQRTAASPEQPGRQPVWDGREGTTWM